MTNAAHWGGYTRPRQPPRLAGADGPLHSVVQRTLNALN